MYNVYIMVFVSHDIGTCIISIGINMHSNSVQEEKLIFYETC